MTKNTTEDQSVGYQFTGIEIVSRSMTPQPLEGATGNFNFEVKVEMRVKAEIDAVIPFVHVEIRDEQTKVGHMVVACIFEIESFEKVIKQNEKHVFVIPIQLQNNLAPIAISTTRGILFSEFRGTWLQQAIMPVIPVQQLQPENIKIASKNPRRNK